MPVSVDSPAANNGSPAPTRLSQPIETSPNKFLLYGITYLLSAPSDLSLNILGKDDLFMAFLHAAGVTDDNDKTECLAFARSIASDTILNHSRLIMHEALQDDFGDTTYSPTPCPNGTDSLAIMIKMRELRDAAINRP